MWWLHAVKTDCPKLTQKKKQTTNINIAVVPENIGSLAFRKIGTRVF